MRALAELSPDTPLAFPRDFGSHEDSRVEWWYITGALETGSATHGFQITFFRSRVAANADSKSRFAAKQLIFAHAAVTDMTERRLRHDQRIARSGFGLAEASSTDTALALRDWSLERQPGAAGSVYRARAHSETAGFAFDFSLAATQPVLLQGKDGMSRKGPQPAQFSRYYSEPQLKVSGQLTLGADARPVRGQAWLDHEWADSLLDPESDGWDWIGMNLKDGGALTAFRIRRTDGSPQWAGGSFRTPAGQQRDFGAGEVRFEPVRSWSSPSTRGNYPVEWRVYTPAGAFRVKARLDNQELDSRNSTGSIYWEGLSDLLDVDGNNVVGTGYLEMTGYAGTLAI